MPFRMRLYIKILSLYIAGLMIGFIILPSPVYAQADGDANVNVSQLSTFDGRVNTPATAKKYVYKGNSVGDFLNAQGGDVEPPRPISLEEIKDLRRENLTVGGDSGLSFDIRAEALREGAISFGARSGLAWRTYEIRKQLNSKARYMDKVYNFGHLLIPAPSGFLIEPPIISESLNAMLIEGDGLQAAVTDKIYSIVDNATIVSTPRSWREYLEREWGDTAPPPDILRPENDEERELWERLVTIGWQEGVNQANEIFQDDLNLLNAEFTGMVRYRTLLAQNMVSPPHALQVDRGVTGTGDQMRIGDRAVQITGIPELITGSQSWQPAQR